MLRIHLDDQMDSKSLMGAYICTSRPGEFVWQPGPLTQAVAQGRWVLIEDINLAPVEVLAALTPLLERRSLSIPSRAETVHAAPGFQLITTVTSDPSGSAAGAYGSSQSVKDLLGGLFQYVTVEAPDAGEQVDIMRELHPSLAHLLERAMATLALMRVAFGQLAVGSAAVGVEVQGALAAGSVRPGEASIGRHFSFRDAMKWARRMVSLHSALLLRALPAGGREVAIEALPIAVREAAFVEAADCFCGLVSRADLHRRLLTAIAALWGVPSASVEQHRLLAKPTVQMGPMEMTIGRASLPLLDAAGSRKTRRTLTAAMESRVSGCGGALGVLRSPTLLCR